MTTRANVGPVSIPSSSFISVTPLSLSPLTTAHVMGAAPRYFGSSDACTFTHPSRGASSTSRGRMRPYATTSATSTPCSRAHAPNSPVRSFVGCTTARPSSSARTFTAGGVTVSPRPAGLSGWHTTAVTWAIPVSASSEGTAKAGEPKNSARGCHGIGATVICTRGWLTSWSTPSNTPVSGVMTRRMYAPFLSGLFGSFG